MAYKRRYRRRRNYRRGNNSTRRTAQKALYLAKKANSMAELKYTNQSTTPATGTAFSSGYTTELSIVAEGTQQNNRIGNTIHPTSMRIRFNWDSDCFPAATDNYRIIIFRWISETPTVGYGNALDVLEQATINSFKSEPNRYQSEILYDRSFWALDEDVRAHPAEIKVPLKHPINYKDGTSAAIRNGIYLLYINDNAGTTHVDPLCQWRLFYRDP